MDLIRRSAWLWCMVIGLGLAGCSGGEARAPATLTRPDQTMSAVRSPKSSAEDQSAHHDEHDLYTSDVPSDDNRAIAPRIGIKAQGSSQSPSGGAAPSDDASSAWDEFVRSGREPEGGPPPTGEGDGGGSSGYSSASPEEMLPGAAAPPDDMPSAPESSADASDAADTPIDHVVVKVFYGTDRRPRSQPLVNGRTYIERFLPMALAALLTAAAILLSPRLFKQRLSPTWTLLGMGASIVLGLSGVWSCWKLHLNYIQPRNDYGNGRGDLTVGTCEVTIPRSHQPGELETPSILRLEVRPDSSRHIVLKEVTPLSPDDFFAEMQFRVNTSPEKDALVFVHGFDNTFENAVRRTAQMAHDLHLGGAAICYSWPSQGGLFKYFVDESNVEATVPNFKKFLLEVAARSDAQRIHLVAHSMGNRALTDALLALSHEVKRPLFNEVILTAPDVDAQVFRRDIVPAIAKTCQRTTLYASSNDLALSLSRRIHGQPRAGDSGRALIVLPGLDTVDVSAVDTSLLGHSYYGSNESVLADIYNLIHTGDPPARRRWLRQEKSDKLPYWIFGEATTLARPDGPTLR